MGLIVLHDRTDVARVAAHAPAAFSGTVLAWDLPAHLELAERGIAHALPDDILTAADYRAARKFEQVVQAFWRDHARIQFAGIDLLAMARFRHVAALARIAWATFLVRTACRRLTPECVHVLDSPGGHALEQPPGCSALPWLQSVVRGVAERMGIATRGIGGERTTFVDRAAAASHSSSRPIDLASHLTGRRLVIFHGSGGDLLRQLPLIRQLHQSQRVDVVQLYAAADRETLHALSRVGHLVAHERQVLCADDDLPVEHPHATARAAFDTARATADDAAAWVFQNPLLACHWDFVFGAYATRMAGHVRRWRSFLADYSPNLVVAHYPTPLFEVAARDAVPCLLLNHGRMTAGDPRWYRCLPATTIGAATPADRARIIQAGIPPERIHVVQECAPPKQSRDCKGADESTTAADSSEIDAHECRVQRPQPHPQMQGPEHRDHRILLITSAIADPAHQADLPAIDWRKAINTFTALAELAATRRDWHFTIQPHPRYDQVELYQRLAADSSQHPLWHINQGSALAPAVDAADVVVVVNNRSSAIIEASLRERPVLLLHTAVAAAFGRAWSLDKWPTVDGVSALTDELERLFGSDDAWRRHRLEETQAAASAFLDLDACSPAETQFALVHRLLEVPDAASRARTDLLDGTNELKRFRRRHAGSAAPTLGDRG
jgi:hypothetical protein